ncbi:MAG: efflux RND transporter periplasmic adaptor subunit [Alcanivoracaceae bacterium]|nr:efflux RND transporter periplasmic adaptor subunit [Alcanivoracaceae bacterium]
MSKLFKRLVPVVVIIASIFIVQALVAAKPTPEKKPKEQRLLSLYVDKVEAETVKLSVTSHGEIKPQTEIDLTAQVSGQIMSISNQFAEGAEFSSQSVLIKIDDRDYKTAVIRAQAQVASAKVNVQEQLANSKIKKEQWKRKKNKGTPSDYALNKPQIAEAKALLRAAEADLQSANLNLARTEIKAPFKGRVLIENISIGQYITPATILGHIFSTDIVEVRLPLTDSQMVELNLPMGFMADEHNAPVVTLSANVGNQLHHWQGRIVRTNAAIDQQTRLIYAVAEIIYPYNLEANNNTALAVGMYVTATIDSNNSQDALVLPSLALHNSDKVYVINDESKLEIRKVTVLSTSKDFVYVSDGVEAGEKVVTSTVPAVVDGMKVKALERQTIGQSSDQPQQQSQG